VNDAQLTVFAEKTIEKSFISHLVCFTIDHNQGRQKQFEEAWAAISKGTCFSAIIFLGSNIC
jgi:hypothetical protein